MTIRRSFSLVSGGEATVPDKMIFWPMRSCTIEKPWFCQETRQNPKKIPAKNAHITLPQPRKTDASTIPANTTTNHNHENGQAKSMANSAPAKKPAQRPKGKNEI